MPSQHLPVMDLARFDALARKAKRRGLANTISHNAADHR